MGVAAFQLVPDAFWAPGDMLAMAGGLRRAQPERRLLKTTALPLDSAVRTALAAGMAITATIMNTATGRPIQTMSFGRMPKPWASFNLATGELVTAERIDIGKPAPGKFAAPVDVWVTLKPKD